MIKYSTILDLINHSQIDAAGELLRSLFYKDTYNSFEFHNHIVLEQEQIPIPWVNFDDNDIPFVVYDEVEPGEFSEGYFAQVGYIEYENKKIKCSNYCDGDTCVIIECEDFILVNSDAKKQYWDYFDNLDNYFLHC